MKKNIIIILLSAGLSHPLLSQTTPAKINDSNTALHLLPPDYPVPYGPQKTEAILTVLDRIYTLLEASTPAKMIDIQSKAEITDLTKLTSKSVFEPGFLQFVHHIEH